MKSSIKTLIGAMRILSQDIQGGDGTANAAILEAAERLEVLEAAFHDAVKHPKGSIPISGMHVFREDYYEKDKL